MKTRVILTGVLLCGLVGGAAVGAEPLADKVPGGALVYAGWAGQSLTFSGSMLGQLVSDPATGRILAAIRDAAVRKMPDDEARQLFQHAWGMAKVAWKHPIAVVLLDLKAGKAGPPQPTGAVLIDLGRDRETFAKHLDAVLARLAKDTPLARATVGEVTYKTLKTPPGIDVSFGYIGNVFFAAAGADTPKRLIELAAPKSLKADKKFAAAMKAVSGENVQAAFYVDIKALLKAVEALTPGPGGAAGRSGPPVKRITAALGLDKVQALAGTVRVIDRGMYTKVKLLTPAPHRGVLLALAGKPLTEADLATIPADAIGAAAVNLSPKDAYDELRKAVRTIDPNAEKEIVSQLDEIGKQMGVSIADDVLANLGDTWVFASAPSLGGLLTGTVLSVEVKEEAKFKAAAGKITAFFKKTLAGGSRPGGRIETVRENRTDIHYLSFAGRGMPLPVAPAWAVHKKRLYVAAWPQVIQAVIANGSKRPLTKDPAFQKARARITGRPSVLCYCNVPAILRHTYPFLLAGWTMGAGALSAEIGAPASPTWLPSLPKMEKYLWPQISGISADAEGITFEGYGSLPGAGLVAGPMGSPLTVAMLMGALGQARHKAKRSVSMSNLHMIGPGLYMYAEDHDGKLPPSLGAMAKDYLGGTKVLVSPLSGRKPPRLVDGKLVGEIDYVYIPFPSVDAVDSPSEVIVAYERPENHKGKGTIALFLDAHVEWMDIAAFKKALNRTQELRKKRKDDAEDF